MCSLCRPKTDTNKLTNPGLDNNSLAGWTLGGTASGYSANDADNCGSSGSIKFADIGDHLSSDCISATANVSYHLAYRFKAMVISSLPQSSGDCSIAFFTDFPACNTSSASSAEVISPLSSGNWVSASDNATAPTGTNGARVTCAGFAGYGFYDQFYLGTGNVAF